MRKTPLLATVAMLLLPIVALPITRPRDLNLIENPGFEKPSVRAWLPFDSCSVESYGRAGHSGKRALAFRPGSEGAGVRLDLSAAVRPGFAYVFKGWFRNLEAGWGQADAVLLYRTGGETRQMPLGRADCNEDGWKDLSVPFAVPAGADPKGLELLLKTGWGRNAFLTDDLELRPALQAEADRAPGREVPDLVFRLGPESPARGALAVSAEIRDSRGRRLDAFVQPLDKPATRPLGPGLYRLVARVSDLDGRVFEAEKTFHAGPLGALAEDLEGRVTAVLSDGKRTGCHGWIRYLDFLAEDARVRDGAESERRLDALLKLDRWTRTVSENPAVMDTMSGVHEWAYPSRADETGQPFKIAIPTAYDSSKKYPLVVVMHGYGGNHMEYSDGVASHPEYFELHVLGRARGGGYTNLSEADVLDGVDYVKAHWSVDERRVHLTGASMGGGGTFKLSTRFPDRWASGRPVCGYGSELPILNALNVPLYSTHSQDDPSVPVLASRAPLGRLAEAGGQVIVDETNGLQHAAWNYAEGNARGQEWFPDHLRPDFRDVRRIDFTAVDAKARRAYWLEIAEWGNRPGPARIRAAAGPANRLYLHCDNVQTLLVRTGVSPFDPAKDLRVSVNGGAFFSVPAPLPDSLFMNHEKGIWSAGTGLHRASPFAPHTPGGVNNLYAGEPLLVVYGTSGGDSAAAAMFRAAVAASKSMHPMWVGDGGDVKDGVPSHHMLYGRLRIKPDTAVTAADIEACSLVLIGRADENRLVAKMADRLPVRFGDEIVCSDGLRLPSERAMIGLYHFNPLAPGRLIYWVAAARPGSYRPYPFLFQLQDGSRCGLDFLAVQDDPPRILRARAFDSRWNWNPEFENTPALDGPDARYGGLIGKTSEAMRITAGADFVLQSMAAPPGFEVCAPGLTRWSDVALLDMTLPLAVLHLSGAQVMDYRKGFSEAKSPIRFFPEPDSVSVSPDRNYRIVMYASFENFQALVNLRNSVPGPVEIPGVTLYEAIRQVRF